MDTKIFWEIIEQTKINVGFGDGSEEDYDAFKMDLINRLAKLELPEIIKWGNIFTEYHKLSYKRKLWAAAYIFGSGGCSDDWFEYFRDWLIVQGKSIFMNALKDPDSLAEVEETKKCDPFFEEIRNVDSSAYCEKLGLTELIENDEYDFDYDAFDLESERYKLSDEEKKALASEIVYDDNIDINWSYDELNSLLPKLYKIWGSGL